METTKKLGDLEYSVHTEDQIPGHDDKACGKCTFVSDRAFIHVAPALTEQAQMTTGKMLKCVAQLADLFRRAPHQRAGTR